MTAPATTDWRALPAGTELDVLVATRVLGLAYDRVDSAGTTYHEVRAPGQTHATFLRPYSTNIRDAWAVVEHLQRHGCAVRLSNKTVDWAWWAYVYSKDALFAEATCQEPTAPLAICRAALAAMETQTDG
jgi:hypothetical protein